MTRGGGRVAERCSEGMERRGGIQLRWGGGVAERYKEGMERRRGEGGADGDAWRKSPCAVRLPSSHVSRDD